jgi:outer membrane protein assembly factor BamB
MGALFSFTLTLAAASWPQFRGANSDAHYDGPPTPLVWSDETNVLWKQPLPGNGWSSPVVVDGRVYLTTAVPQGAGLSLRALALDTSTGEIVWDREIRAVDEAPAIHAKNSHASPTPIVRDGAVYVHFGNLGMAKLSAADGEIVWTNHELVYSPVHGSGGTPMLHDGKLVVACDGSSEPFVAAVDAVTGEIVWKQKRSVPARISHSFVTVTVAEVDGHALVLAPGPEHFAAYDLADGTEVCRVLAPGWSVVPQPAVGHGLVYYNHDYDNPELMAVRLGGAGDVTETHIAWRLKRGAPSTPSPLLVGSDLFLVNDEGIASCVDALSGETLWMQRLGGNYSASPVLASGRVLFLSETGQATWVAASREFEQIATCEIPGQTLATPAFADGAMYLRTDTALYKIGE